MTPCTDQRHSVNRLTAEDRARIYGRMSDARRGWPRDWRPTWADLPAMERLGWHAIGCDERDLRDCELAEISDMARGVLGLPINPEPSQG